MSEKNKPGRPPEGKNAQAVNFVLYETDIKRLDYLVKLLPDSRSRSDLIRTMIAELYKRVKGGK